MTTPAPHTQQDQVSAYLAQVEPEARARDAQRLDQIFRETTGFHPRLWSESIIGYGLYQYRYASGRAGTYLATGFAPRQRAHSVYIMPGYADFSDILNRLGKVKAGRSCVYITKLDDIDVSVLRELIEAGLEDLGTRWRIEAT